MRLRHVYSAIAFLALFFQSSAQVSTTIPQEYLVGSPLDTKPKVRLSHNTAEQIRHEVMDINIIRLLAKSADVTLQELNGFAIAPGPLEKDVWFYLLKDQEGNRRFADRLMLYLRAREGGHTKECLLTVLTNQTPSSLISDPDLRAFIIQNPLLPAGWVKREESSAITNKAHVEVTRSMRITKIDDKLVTRTIKDIPEKDEVHRLVSFIHVDGDVAWRYKVRFNPNGAIESLDELRFDAKEMDPRLATIIHDVEVEVTAELKREALPGSVRFLLLKQKKLATKGIDWRAPFELNPASIKH
jgi:hypothetical protein